MSTRNEIAIRETQLHAVGGNKMIWLRRGAFVALIAAIVAVTTTVVLVGGAQSANACLFCGIPC